MQLEELEGVTPWVDEVKGFRIESRGWKLRLKNFKIDFNRQNDN